MKYLLALCLPLAVMACGDGVETDGDATVETITPAVTTNTMPTTSEPISPDTDMDAMGMTSANETMDAIRSAGGITNMAPATAVANIDNWIAKLDGMDGTSEVTDNLKELKMQLTSGNIDGAKVGQLLAALGEDTQELGRDNTAVSGLGQALASAGAQLN